MYTISFLEQSSMSGYHRAPKGNFEEERLLNLDRSINRYRWLLLIFNVLAIMVALATFCVCIWIRLVYNIYYCKMVTKVILIWRKRSIVETMKLILYFQVRPWFPWMGGWNRLVFLLACYVRCNAVNGLCCNSINHWNIWRCWGS